MTTSPEGVGSAASCPWSLTHEQQVDNLLKNCKRAFENWMEDYGYYSNPKPLFERVVSQLREDPLLDRCNELELDECQIDQILIGGFVSGARMTSLHLAILMGDLKMVQKILERSSDPDNLVQCGPQVFPKKISTICEDPKKNEVLYMPLHLAVASGDRSIIDELVKRGANVNAPSLLHQTPLELAWKLQEIRILQQLLEVDEDKKEVAHVAVRYGDVNLMKKHSYLDVNARDGNMKTPLHHLASRQYRTHDVSVSDIVQYLAENKALDTKALDIYRFSAFYVAVLCCNTKLVFSFLDSFKDHILLNEECVECRGPPIQIAFEGGYCFKDIYKALMECVSVKSYINKLYRDRQVYVDAANAILVGAALIASVTFASWLQPPLNYTSYSGEGYLSSVPTPSTSNLNYVDVEHNIALRAFWVFNALSFYFAIATVVFGTRSVLLKNHLFIKKIVEKLHTNLLVTSTLFACSVLFVIVAFAIAGTIVLTPLVKYQWCMIVPTIVGGIVCLTSLGFLVKSMGTFYGYNNRQGLKKDRDYLEHKGYVLQI